MHFCSKCDNMYYIKLMEQNNNNLVYYCRHCGNEDVNITSKMSVFLRHLLKLVAMTISNLLINIQNKIQRYQELILYHVRIHNVKQIQVINHVRLFYKIR